MNYFYNGVEFADINEVWPTSCSYAALRRNPSTGEIRVEFSDEPLTVSTSGSLIYGSVTAV